jgi:peptidoglycan/LPS O-acetylase OafA/YrhL
LSAFLLSQHWLKADYLGQPRPSLKKYWRHRFFRIVPAYYACLFLMLLFLCPLLISPSVVYSAFGLKYLGAHLLFLQFLTPITSASYGINGSLWTLTLEMIFYLLLPCGVLLFLRNRWLVAMPLVLAMNILWLYLARNHLGPLVHYAGSVTAFQVDSGTIRFYLARQFPGYAAVFGIGIVLANLFVRYRLGLLSPRVVRLLTNPWAGFACAICGWLIVFDAMKRIYSASHHGGGIVYLCYLRDLMPSLGFALALAGLLFGGQRLRKLFSFAPLRLIGLISYSVYLWHLPLINLYAKFPEAVALSPEHRFSFILVWGFAATILLSIALYFAIEKPFLALGRRSST